MLRARPVGLRCGGRINKALVRRLAESTEASSSLPVPKDTNRLDNLLVFPLFRRPVFPNVMLPIVIPDTPFRDEVHRSLKSHKDVKTGQVGLFLVKDSNLDPTNAVNRIDQIHDIGVLAKIRPGKNEEFLVTGISRIKVLRKSTESGFLYVDAERILYPPYEPDPKSEHAKKVTEVMGQMFDVLKTLQDSHSFIKAQLQMTLNQFNSSNWRNPYELADLLAVITNSPAKSLQAVLEAHDPLERCQLALMLLQSELDIMQRATRINEGLHGSPNEKQRREVLEQQLERVKQQLDLDTDEKEVAIDAYRARIEKEALPEHALKIVHEELAKLSTLDPSSMEYNITKNYLDWLTLLPWSTSSTENLDLVTAEGILDMDHFGLEDVKERILEHIAVGSLKGRMDGKIICLVGPPGVGKTSIGKSISRSLNREFFRFSVGGLQDVSEIKGHRRTYIGAIPGKFIQCFKRVATSNPVIMIDEIDKLGFDGRQDPASALLEALDPEQNTSFLDHYLDVPYDLSKVLFVCTANTLDTIPGPLLDRMEVIRLSGYMSHEKSAIAKNYLIKNALSDSGLTSNDVALQQSAINLLIKSYCREAGVRNLQKHIEKIYRKAAFKLTENDEQLVVTDENLSEFVGRPLFSSDRVYSTTPVGIVMGLAWTSMGGATLYVESVRDIVKKNGITVTGQLGDVFKESQEISHVFAKNFLHDLDPRNLFFKETGVHVHIPEGGTPKDGPSAGIALVTSLLSLAMDVPVQEHLAMTGEVTLTGKVLRIGGVKEKCLAAQRAEVTDIVLPKGNVADYDELPEHLKKGLNVTFVSDYSEVFDVAFEGLRKKTKLKTAGGNTDELPILPAPEF